MDEFEWVRSFATSSYGSYETISSVQAFTPQETGSSTSTPMHGSFASFVCHVISLQRKLRSFSPIVLDDSSVVRDTGKILGQGTTFMVRHAQWVRDPKEPPLDVALKEIIPDVQSLNDTPPNSYNRPQGDWKEILFELRALLHEPIRYHPNIVRLLGIQWGLSPMSESTFPLLIMEYGSLGTFASLQASSEPLSFATKQKLCYDVGRALYALHSCGIVHGDMKHENVLIFPAKKPINGITYTAKLADFGGTVMDMEPNETRRIKTWTWPFQAPEVTSGHLLTRSGMMLTDTYSFGLLIWRAFLDGEGFVSLSGASQNASDQDKETMNTRKASEGLTKTAITEIYRYSKEQGISQDSVDAIAYSILHTVRLEPKDRNIVKAQAALRGIQPGHIPKYLEYIQEKNDELAAAEARSAPGRHGITRDALKFMLGRWGDDADLQDNMPGFRPRLNEPNNEEFSFEPENLKSILTWDQQHQMLDEMKAVGGKTHLSTGGLLEMKPTVAAFYVFQCYLLEFGTGFNAEEAIQWLLKAASDDDSHEEVDYLAQAWIWRLSRALGVDLRLTTEKLDGLLRLSLVRGHRTCLQDMVALALESNGPEQQRWFATIQQYRNILLSNMGAVGIGYFFPSFMTAPWNTLDLNNIGQLDEAIHTILGNDYDSCLKTFTSRSFSSTAQQSKDKEKTPFDRIYVNRRGHGPLHYAAALGAVSVLRHLINKYECDINLANQHVDETPLVCASEGGKFDCVLLLLDNGADPNGHRFGQEGPLHWLSNFLPNEMEIIATRIIAAGGDVELRTGGMRHDVRGIQADWEHLFEIRTTPLGRAVLMQNIDAVKVLLKLGANPLNKSANKHRGEWEGIDNISKLIDVASPFELAAVLTLPEILAEFIKHIDGTGAPKLKLIDEVSMLDLAHKQEVTSFDPLSLQSRLVRCGANHKQCLQGTLALLYARALPFHGVASDELQKERSRVLCKEVALGNLDVVECLLQLGYNANGTEHFRPLEKAVELNHEALFSLLMRHNADAHVTRMTPTGSISMLHVCASRPRHSRPGRTIADALIAAGVSLESTDKRSPPPFAMAVLHQNFDVASALLENGANLNATYPLKIGGEHGPETRTVTVLVEVLSQHTMRTLNSLKFLFNQSNSGLIQRPNFYIDPSNKLSILHLLAASPHFTQIAQITPKILNLCLETYADADTINYKHPLLGSALYYAAANGHKAMVERLLQHGADETHHSGPDMEGSVQLLLRPKESWSPLWAAILRLDDELKKCALVPSKQAAGALSSSVVQNLEKTIALLSRSNNDIQAHKAIEQLQRKKDSVETQLRISHMNVRKGRTEVRVSESEGPINLGLLSTDGGDTDIDEKRLREIREGPLEQWRTGELDALMQELAL